jgi:hypothetical protein
MDQHTAYQIARIQIGQYYQIKQSVTVKDGRQYITYATDAHDRLILYDGRQEAFPLATYPGLNHAYIIRVDLQYQIIYSVLPDAIICHNTCGEFLGICGRPSHFKLDKFNVITGHIAHGILYMFDINAGSINIKK